ncbi:MAG: magnesium transporter [Candidatus Aenigmarchaeota archaeon]|nr:magnesium transporter [Candidatus Aenigmarchaeota archaeon]
MPFFDSTFKEILSSQAASVAGGLIAGTLLAFYTDKMLLLPGMLILIPGFLEMRGNISGSFSSRIACGLFLGVVKPEKIWTKIVKGNLVASFLQAILVSFSLGLLAFVFNYVLLGVSSAGIIVIPFVAGIIANAIEIPLALSMTFYLFRKGHDPNNVMGPLLTSTGDVISTISLLAAVAIV